MSPRDLPPADHAFVLVGSDLLPAVVLSRGRWLCRALVFQPFKGSSARRVRTRDVFRPQEANALLAFRNDPMALLRMTGEEPANAPVPSKESER